APSAAPSTPAAEPWRRTCGRDPPDAAVDAGLLEDRLREVRPGALARCGRVVDAERQLDHGARRGGEVPDVRRRTALVVHHGDLLALGAEAEHRANEVAAGRAEEPRGADDPCPLPGGRLAVELRTRVRAQRVRRVGLDV